jgi:hypothetical protein
MGHNTIQYNTRERERERKGESQVLVSPSNKYKKDIESVTKLYQRKRTLLS